MKHNGGGHLNHDFFWRALGPAPRPHAARRARRGADDAIRLLRGFPQAVFGDRRAHFASGWVALAFDPASAKLEIADLKDHEVLETRGRIGLIIIDVWEHAYYLKYQNRRPEFIDAFWNIVNWAHAEEAFDARRSGAMKIRAGAPSHGCRKLLTPVCAAVPDRQ